MRTKDFIVVLFVLFIIFLTPFFFFKKVSEVRAEPIFRSAAGNVIVTLFDEKCQLSEISNLPRRAVWNENGKDVEGCWGLSQVTGAVIFYFSDKTVFDMPRQVFGRVSGV